MMQTFLTWSFLVLLSLQQLIAVDIAITIDDYPAQDGPIFSVQERTDAWIAACAAYSCQAAFFCIGRRCMGEDRIALLDELNKNGHFLCNHSMNHLHLSGQSLEDFREEVIQVDQILTPYPNMRRWYRYPYLDYGNRRAIGGSIDQTFQSLEILNNLEYTEGYVTINTFDWHINSCLAEKMNNGYRINYESLKDVYLLLLKSWCEYYIQLYQTIIPEPITHTLLLHDNDLNALFIHDILNMIQESGWNLVSPERAFEKMGWRDQIFANPELITHKPDTLNCLKLDELLQSGDIFQSKQDAEPTIKLD